MNTIYETGRFILVPFIDYIKAFESKSNYCQWMYDQEVTKYNSHGLFEIIVWAIIVEGNKDSKEHTGVIHIGNISLQSFNWINRSAEFAIVIGEKEYWGKGYATEALKILIEHGFYKLNLHRIWSGTASTNQGMIRVFKKLGMTYEGADKHGVFLDNEYVDVIRYAILNINQFMESCRGKIKKDI
jgi:RimJ/RimL family protein N-acetyltransferase